MDSYSLRYFSVREPIVWQIIIPHSKLHVEGSLGSPVNLCPGGTRSECIMGTWNKELHLLLFLPELQEPEASV
jgi:hypothetical protein